MCVDKNRVLFGTAKGLYSMPLPQAGGSRDNGQSGSAGSARMLPGFDSVVTSIVPARGKIFVGTTTGALMLDGDKIEEISGPARPGGTPFFIVSLAVSDNGAPGGLASVFMGGDFGLARIENNNEIAYLPTPEGTSSITAMAASGPDLLISFEGSLYLFKTLTAQWVRVAYGTTYTALCFLHSQNSPSSAWIGLRSDGGIDAGSIAPQALFTSLALPLSQDPATAISALYDSNDSKSDATILIGTIRGTILSGTIFGSGQASLRSGDIDFSIVRTDSAAFPIRTLLSPKGATGIIYAGTDGGGIVQIDCTTGITSRQTCVEKTIMSREDIGPGRQALTAPVDASQISRRTADGRIARVMQFVLRNLPLSRLPLYGGLVGVVAGILLFWKLLTLRSSNQSSQVKERRREPGAKVDLPKLSELSLELAAHARRFQDVTSEINELSRHAVSGDAAETAERTQKVTLAFEEIDVWMRNRLAELRKQREDKIAQLALLRARARDQQPDDPDHLDQAAAGAELDGIERWLEAVNRDEKYLKYVLEE